MNNYGSPIIIRSHSFKAWMRGNFNKQQFREICRYGVRAGYYGLINHRDLRKVYGRFKDEIHEYVDRSGLGFAEFVQHVEPDDMDDLAEKMTWYAAEAIAAELLDNEE